MAKTTTTQKEPVRLREKKLSNGNVSLYLDICRNGRRHKEYLKLYLIDAKTPLEREQNRQVQTFDRNTERRIYLHAPVQGEHALFGILSQDGGGTA